MKLHIASLLLLTTLRLHAYVGAPAASDTAAPPSALPSTSPASTAAPAVAISNPAAIASAFSAAQRTDRLIIKYRTTSAEADTGGASASADNNAQAAAILAQARLRNLLNMRGLQAERLRSLHNGAHLFQLSRGMTGEQLAGLVQALLTGDGSIEYAEADRLMLPAYTPNDTLYARQWYLFNPVAGIRAPTAWDRSMGTGTVVAVIDTGVRPHVDLLPNLLPGYDFITALAVANDGNARDSDAQDPGDATTAGECGAGSRAANSSWHGTHVAGIVAAVAGNGLGVSGVAPQARVLPVRVMGRCGGYVSDIADGMVWAAGGNVAGVPVNPFPAKVLNLSLGIMGLSCGATMQSAVNSARGQGAAVVAAAGNSNISASFFSPANCSGVIAVAATGPTGGKASYSNTGTVVALAAPGGEGESGIVSTLNAGASAPEADAYAAYMGTSMATPVVSGVAALMLAVRPALTPDNLARLLRASATPFPGACSGCGSGLVNADAAVQAALDGVLDPPPPPVGPTLLAEIEPNNTLTSAQALTPEWAEVMAGLMSARDNDYFRVTIAPGKTLEVSAGPTAGLGLRLTGYFSFLPWYSSSGVRGAKVSLSIPNVSLMPLTVSVRVQRASGSAGDYTLSVKQ
ncbi:MAG: S8 family peptidase [Rubrivivax sp.]|nr:S8 family peptidase [Rubrivivax sp.]